jgi:hypothetical protein
MKIYFNQIFILFWADDCLFIILYKYKNFSGFYVSVYEWRGLYERKIGFLVHLQTRTYKYIIYALFVNSNTDLLEMIYYIF